MSLFAKKKENNKEERISECTCNGSCTQSESEINQDNIINSNSVINIKVLGSGCKNCQTLLDNTKKAVALMPIKSNIEYITDMQKIMSYGVMSMPALVVNEKVVSMGKVCKPEEIEKLLSITGH